MGQSKGYLWKALLETPWVSLWILCPAHHITAPWLFAVTVIFAKTVFLVFSNLGRVYSEICSATGHNIVTVANVEMCDFSLQAFLAQAFTMLSS
jgi:hypothetical protein